MPQCRSGREVVMAYPHVETGLHWRNDLAVSGTDPPVLGRGFDPTPTRPHAATVRVFPAHLTKEACFTEQSDMVVIELQSPFLKRSVSCEAFMH